MYDVISWKSKSRLLIDSELPHGKGRVCVMLPGGLEHGNANTC